jgi:hypothetical protein
MAINKSNENTRVAKLLAMSTDDVKLLCSVGINNPAIHKQFANEEAINWDYAVAAGLISWDDAQWIKTHVNEEDNNENNNEDNTNS